MRHIPNLLTSMNLAAGFISIIFAAKGDLITASWFIAGAMIFDFADGFFARMLHAYSLIGKELDSLADVVSFGVAPALLIYQLIDASVPASLPELSIFQNAAFTLVITAPVLMPVCAALRLAKFNIDTEQAISFRGLPTPASAIAVISLLIAEHYSDIPVLQSFSESPASLAAYTIVLSVLMVTRIPLLSLKLKNLKPAGNEGRYLLAVLVLFSFIFLGIAAAPLIIPFYLISSWISSFFQPR